MSETPEISGQPSETAPTAERVEGWMGQTGERLGRAVGGIGQRVRGLTTRAREQASQATPASGQTGSNQGSAEPESETTCPSGYPVKGNVRTNGERLYHVPGQSSYGRTHPECCFATEADARSAGYRPAWPGV
ncbi:MAG TPA: hypothetical protein VFS96_05470 [Nitrolancea sp.]|nr:hypothetical protein [Nitrolancea sp.]